MEIWHVWIIVSIALFIAEIFTPGFVLACFGIACLISGLVSFFELGFKIQIITFSVSTLIVFFGIRPLFLRHFYSSQGKTKTNVDALVDKAGLVLEKIDPAVSKGRVMVGGENWRGISVDEAVIEPGEKIVVVGVEGTKLLVKAISREG